MRENFLFVLTSKAAELMLPSSFCQLCQNDRVPILWASGIGQEHEYHEAHQALGLHQAVQRIINVVRRFHTIPFET